MNTNRLLTLALAGLIVAFPVHLRAQDNQDNQQSVADAARKAQAARKDAPKAKLSIDNDNLSTLTGTVSVVGEQPPSEDQSKQGEAKPGAKEPPKDEAYWRSKFQGARKKLDDDSKELDITQRELNLKQEQFYTDPMASLKQDYSRSDINDTRTKIEQLQAKVDADKAAISDLEDQLRQAGGDPGWANPPSNPTETSENSASSQTEQAPASSSQAPAATSQAPAAQPAPAPATQQQ